MAKVEEIMAKSYVPGTSTKLEITGEFLPLVETGGRQGAVRALRRGAADARRRDRRALFTGGCADSGFASATGAPTICAVGPVGGRAHSPDEYLEIETLVPRAQALALAMLRLTVNAYQRRSRGARRSAAGRAAAPSQLRAVAPATHAMATAVERRLLFGA